jgi:hypothetical protein
MPVYRTNQDIFKTGANEVFESKWFDSNVIVTPKKGKWDYKRELTVDDVEIWEAIYEDNWGLGIYASYEPYAEFYMIKYVDHKGVTIKDTFYGAGSQDKIIKFMLENNIPFATHKVWVENEDLWLFQPPEDKKTIII